MWNNSGRCRIVSVYLLRMWCLYTWSCLDILITMHFSIKRSPVISSPIVILMLSWEKQLEKPVVPRSIFHHISFRSTILVSYLFYFAIFTFQSIKQKYQKYLSYYLYQISLLQVAMKGLPTPLSRWLQGSLFVCAGTRWLACSLLLDWYLGSQKLREILMLLCCITLFSSRENQRMLKR